MKHVTPKNFLVLVPALILILTLLYFSSSTAVSSDENVIAKVTRQSFEVAVRTIGELDAARSLTISSMGKGDNCKIIYLIADGMNIDKDEVLIKIDPTPYEEKLEALRTKLKEHESYHESLKKNLAWEISQAEKDEKLSLFEIEAAELEFNRITKGDGPLEIARLKNAMNKALLKFSEMDGYAAELDELEAQGFLNPTEIRNARKKREEEKESYEASKLQYDSYIEHVYPMLVKKAEAALKQAKIKQEESAKSHGFAVGKAMVELEQALQAAESTKWQYKEAEKELAQAEIRAPMAGMVVHREDFRSGQRRKPRIGDIALKNQPLLDLPDLSMMIVKSKVREVDLCKVEVGKKASIEIDAYPELSLSGSITSIGVLALPDPAKPTEEKYFEIRILLDKSDPKVRPGMTTRVVIHSNQVLEGLTLPVHALFHEQKKTYCYVATKQGCVKREVVAGAHNEELVEIKEGLQEGEDVFLKIPQELLL